MPNSPRRWFLAGAVLALLTPYSHHFKLEIKLLIDFNLFFIKINKTRHRREQHAGLFYIFNYLTVFF